MGPEISPPVQAASAATRDEIQIQERETVARVDEQTRWRTSVEFCGDGAGIGPWRGSGQAGAAWLRSPWSELQEEATRGRGTEDPPGRGKGKVINC